MRPEHGSDDPGFLRKALSEAGNEFLRVLDSVSTTKLHQYGSGVDDNWSLLALAVHLRNCERDFIAQLDAFSRERRPSLRAIDNGDIPTADELETEDEDLVIEELRYLRHHTSYILWDLYASDWKRTGEHPYRGPVTLYDVARDKYEHDLEHLWQARRMVESLGRWSRASSL